MSRVVGRTRSTREATASWALPHLQLAALPGTHGHFALPPLAAAWPPERGGGHVKGHGAREAWRWETGHAGQSRRGAQ
jgi:hypothetical protein